MSSGTESGNQAARTGLCIIVALYCLLPLRSGADITTDGSLGSAVSLAGPDYAIVDTLGRQVGGNLFHSFQTFNVGTGETATFSGPPTVVNILSRVTGGTASSIDGALNSSIPGANLYLVNPSGVIFGPKASLNVSGAFHVSTANYVKLADGTTFDTTMPVNSALSSAPPSAFGFLTTTPAPISIQGGLLEVTQGAEISVSGGDLSITDGFLFAPAGSIKVASVASPGEVVLAAPDLGTGEFAQLGRMDITHTGGIFSRLHNGMLLGNIDATGDPGGTVVIRAGEFVLDNASVFADNRGTGQGGRVDVDVTGELRLTNESLLSADAYDSGPAGTVSIAADTLRLETGGAVQVGNFGPQSGGDISITVDTSVVVDGVSPDVDPLRGGQNSRIIAVTFGDGDGGNVHIQSPEVVVSNGGQIALESAGGAGNAGTLLVEADSMQLSNRGEVIATTSGAGDAGTVMLEVGALGLTEGGNISTATAGSGNGGEVFVNATRQVTASGQDSSGPSGIFSNSFSSGDGGRIRITTPLLTLENGAAIQAAVAADTANPGLPPASSTTRAGNIDLQVDTLALSGTAQISTQSENAGQAGSIAITAADALTINSPAGSLQSGVYSTAAGSGSGGSISISGGRFVMQGGAVNVSSAGSGDAGSVSVVTDSLQMSNGAQISTATSGTGNGGSLQVQTTGNTRLAGTASDGFQTGLYSQAQGGGTGGDIQVSAASVGLANKAVISAESLGTGDAGNIDVAAASEVTLDNASITTEALIADGGNININASYQVYLLNSEVTTSVGTGFGDGGNITIDPEFVVLNNSRILANAYGGDGGNITIVTDHFLSSTNSTVEASSQLGINGTINIIAPDEEVTSNVEELPVSYLDATGLLRERCSARRFSDRSSFTMGGRQGVPPAPAGMSALSSSISDSLNARYAAPAPGLSGSLLPSTLSQGALLPAAYLAAGLWGCSG